MKSLRIFFLSAISLVITSMTYSQESKSLNKLFPLDGYCLDRNQIEYNPPKKFIHGVDTLERKDRLRLKCITSKDFRGLYLVCYNYLISKDSNFLVCISVPPIYCEIGSKDSIYIDPGLMPELKTKIDTYHLHYVATDFWQNTGGKVTSLEHLPIRYHSSKYAHEAFNADTVITYPLKVWQKFQNKYNHCQAMLIQKNRRGMFVLYCFYNDKAAKRLNRYTKALEKVFWYRDPKDYIEVVEPKVDSIYVIPHLKKKTQNYEK